MCVPRISYTADAGAFAFLTADLALPSEEPVRHVLALADRHDAAAVQAVFLRDSSPSSRAEVRVGCWSLHTFLQFLKLHSCLAQCG